MPKSPQTFWLFKVLICIVIFLLASIIFDMAQVLCFVFIFPCYLGGIDSSSWMISPMTAFVFLEGLLLRLMSRRRIVRLHFIFILVGSLFTILPISLVLIFLDQQPISFEVPGINLSSQGKYLQVSPCFCIDSLLYNLISRIYVLPSMI